VSKVNYHDLVLVNTRGNAFPYKSEAGDDWTPWGDEKDCDSFMSWKHWQLFHKHGWAERSLRGCCCFTEPFQLDDPLTGERRWATKRECYHAILLADCDDTTYGLDNRHAMPMLTEDLEALGYEWHKFWSHDLNAWEWAKNADRSIA
jgi:hypothetical protein